MSPSPGCRDCSAPQLLGMLPTEHFAGWWLCLSPSPPTIPPGPLHLSLFSTLAGPHSPWLDPAVLSPGLWHCSAIPRDPSQPLQEAFGAVCRASCQSWQLPGVRSGSALPGPCPGHSSRCLQLRGVAWGDRNGGHSALCCDVAER